MGEGEQRVERDLLSWSPFREANLRLQINVNI